MSKRSTRHATFTIERRFAQPPQRVFAAYADAKAKALVRRSRRLGEVGPRARLPRGWPLVYTEQAVYLDGHDDPDSRERGTNSLFDNLAAALDREIVNRSS